MRFAAVFLLALGVAQVPPQPGARLHRWSDPATWPDHVLPRAHADVVVPKGAAILLDVSTPDLGTVRVDGELTPDTLPVELRANAIVVTGRLVAGRADHPHRARFAITLLERPGDADSSVGKSIIVQPGGAIELFGEAKTSWLHLDKTTAIGASSIT